MLKEGQEVQVKVLSVDPDQHRLALSIKALQERPEGMEEERPSRNNNSRGEGRPRRNNSRNEHTKIPAEYQQDDSGFSLGDILGDALKDAAKGAEDNDK